MVVDVVDHTGLVAGHDAVRALVEAALEAEEASGEVSVAFVDEASIADLNRRYREAEGPTDVLAFDYADEGGAAVSSGAISGEVVVCPQVVMRYAAEEGRAAIVQLGWTLIHGTLHLAGYDHETDRGEMRQREQDLLKSLDGCVQTLVLTSESG
jgi:probable rRNA maturation factor